METFIKKLGEAWYLILALVALGTYGATQSSRLSAVEAKQNVSDVSQANVLAGINGLSIDMAVVKTDVNYIKQEIKK